MPVDFHVAVFVIVIGISHCADVIPPLTGDYANYFSVIFGGGQFGTPSGPVFTRSARARMLVGIRQCLQGHSERAGR